MSVGKLLRATREANACYTQHAFNLWPVCTVCHKTATCTRDIIGNGPAVNTINRRGVLHVLYYIVNFRILANI